MKTLVIRKYYVILTCVIIALITYCLAWFNVNERIYGTNIAVIVVLLFALFYALILNDKKVISFRHLTLASATVVVFSGLMFASIEHTNKLLSALTFTSLILLAISEALGVYKHF